jgi:hypothetical protein
MLWVKEIKKTNQHMSRSEQRWHKSTKVLVGVSEMYVFNLYTLINENTFVLQPIQFPNKHTKLPYTFHLVLTRSLILYNIKITQAYNAFIV